MSPSSTSGQVSFNVNNFDNLVIAGLEADATATTTVGAISKDIVLEMREALDRDWETFDQD